VLNVVDESPDKDGFSTSGCSRNHAGKRVGPRHEVIRKSCAGYFKHERVVRRVNKVRFLCFDTHDDVLVRYNLVVLRRLSTFVRNRKWSRIRSRTAKY
jgi:hypothetical protein